MGDLEKSVQDFKLQTHTQGDKVPALKMASVSRLTWGCVFGLKLLHRILNWRVGISLKEDSYCAYWKVACRARQGKARQLFSRPLPAQLHRGAESSCHDIISSWVLLLAILSTGGSDVDLKPRDTMPLWYNYRVFQMTHDKTVLRMEQEQ